MTRLTCMIGIQMVACMLVSVCVYGKQYTVSETVAFPVESGISLQANYQHHTPTEKNTLSSPAFFWLDCEFFQEWRELVGKIVSAERSGGTSIAMNIVTDQELGYQHVFLEQKPGSFAALRPETFIFRITEHTLQHLRDAGVPDELLFHLERIKGRQFAEQEVLWEALESCVGQTMLMEYHTAILTYAIETERSPGLGSTIVSPATFYEHRSPSSQENIAAWNALWNYPKALKKTLSSPGTTSVVRTTSYDSDEDQSVWNIRALLKRWGVPKPSILILIGLGFYLFLALLSRR